LLAPRPSSAFIRLCRAPSWAIGEVRNHVRQYGDDDYHLYASLQIVRDRNSQHNIEDDIAKLKAEMAAAHPDRGQARQFGQGTS
jgi:hypothetical protein